MVPCAPKEIKLTPKDEARFWSKVDKSAGPDGCWLWTAGKFRQGYGCFDVAGKSVKAHRTAYTLTNGQIPHDGSAHGLCVCHRCDNPPCCNPAHLFLGTHIDNVRDRENKGRNNPPRGDKHFSRLYPDRVARGNRNGANTHPECVLRGERHGRAKITAAQVIEIRTLYAAGGLTQPQLGERFGLDRSAISLILRRKNWKHI